jgi:Putative transposase
MPRRRRYWKWRPIRSIWAPRSDSSASCTPGDRLCKRIPLFTVSCPEAGCRWDRSRWISSRPHFFLPVKVLSRVFRGKFCDGLQRAFEAGPLAFFGECLPLADEENFRRFLRTVFQHDWVVYSKPPFGGPDHVLQYLARYTPIALPSPIIVFSRSPNPKSGSGGRIMRITAKSAR